MDESGAQGNHVHADIIIYTIRIHGLTGVKIEDSDIHICVKLIQEWEIT